MMKRMRSGFKPALIGLGMLAVLAVAMPTPAAAQDFNARLRQLENQVQTLSRAIFKGEMPSQQQMQGMGTGSTADLEVRMTQLETMLRQMTGEIEKQSFEIRKMRDQMDRALADYENRIRALETGSPTLAGQGGGVVRPGGYPQQGGMQVQPQPGAVTGSRPAIEVAPPSYGGGASSTGYAGSQQPMQQPQQPQNVDPLGLNDRVQPGMAQAQPAQTTTAPAPTQGVPTQGTPAQGTLGTLRVQQGGVTGASTTTATVPSTVAQSPEGLYEYAFTKLRQNDYGGAQAGFTRFLADYADHPLSANAKYWLGETYYVRNEFGIAAKLFAEGYQKHPTSSKAPDNLLKLAMSLSNLNKRDDACVALQQLETQFGSGTGPVIQKAQSEMERLGCR